MSPRYAAKVDRTQAAIVDALRGVGASVHLLHRLGGGCPDALVGFRSHWYVLELKGPGGSLTAAECRWINDARAEVGVVETVDQALRWIGALA